MGVFFRASAQKRAKELGLTGWARNANGGVEIVAQGEETQLQEFLNWCKQGPKWAKVEKVDVEWEESDKLLRDFKIK